MEGQQEKIPPRQQPQDTSQSSTGTPQTERKTAQRKRSSNNALHKAIQAQDLNMCLGLLEDDRSVNVQDERDWSTALHALARRKWPDGRQIAEILLERGVDVNTEDNAGLTPLHIAARDGRSDLCESLLAHHRATGKLSLNVRYKSTHETPLHYAAKEGQCTVLELLLGAGADPRFQDKNGWLPVHHAASKGYDVCCRLLAFSYTNTGSTKVPSPLTLTIQRGYHRCFEALIPDESSLQYRDSAGNTLLHMVAKKGFTAYVKTLLDLQAPVDEQNGKGNTPLMEAVQYKMLHCVMLLVERGASLARKNQDCMTVLHFAAASKTHKCLEYLLGCQNIEDQLNEKDARGHTALSLAVEKHNEKNFNLLIEAGASATSCFGNSLLHFRYVYRQPSILQKILSSDSSTSNISDEKGVTPLHLAAEEGSKVACSLLLSRGARLNARDNDGRSPLDVAAAARHPEVVRHLVSRGATLRRHGAHFTVLHAAAAAGSPECSKILLDANHGLSNIQDQENRYALDVAFEGGHHEVMRLILDKFKTLPDDLRPRLHKYTHRSVARKDREFLCVIFESKWWEVGCGLDRPGKAPPCPNFRDIISPYPDIASKVMTKCRKDSINDFRLLENTSYISNGDEDGKACLEELGHESAERATLEDHPVGLMVGSERLALLQHPPLLQHPLVEKWIEYKWYSYARWIFLTLLLRRLFTVTVLFFFLLHTTNWKQIEKKHNLTRLEMCGLWFGGKAVEEQEEQEASLLASYTHIGVPGTVTAHLLLTGSLLLQAFVEWLRFRNIRKHYIGGSFFALRLPCMSLTLVALLPSSRCDLILGIKSVYAWECGILALLLSWLDLIHYINQLPQFTMFAALNVSFLKDYVKGLMYFGMVVFIFSFVFHLLLLDQASFQSLPLAMVQVIVWMVGDLNYEDNFLKTNLDYPLLSTSLFLLFVCTVGAFFVTLLKTPSCSKKRLRYLRQTGRINLLLKIDICFPWFRRLCLAQKYNEKEKIPSLLAKIQEKCVWPSEQNETRQRETSETDTRPRETQVHIYVNKLMSFLENVGSFIQTDDNDDDEREDDNDLRVTLKLVKDILEEQAKQLQEVKGSCAKVLEYCEEQREARLQVTKPPMKSTEKENKFPHKLSEEQKEARESLKEETT